MDLKKVKDILLEGYSRIFARRIFYNLNSFIFDLALRGLGIMNLKESLSGEANFIDYVNKNFKLINVLDVGANQGLYAEKFANSEVNVMCFEPHKETFKVLKKNLSSYKNINTYCFGFSDTKATSCLYDHNINGSQQASIYKEVITDWLQSDVIENRIELSTLDLFLEENSIEKVSLLKIDTEGSEYQVLKGARKSLESNVIEIIQFEFNAMNIYSKVFLRDILLLLESFNIYRLLPTGFLPINYEKHGSIKYELFAYQNIVAFRKDIDLISTI